MPQYVIGASSPENPWEIRLTHDGPMGAKRFGRLVHRVASEEAMNAERARNLGPHNRRYAGTTDPMPWWEDVMRRIAARLVKEYGFCYLHEKPRGTVWYEWSASFTEWADNAEEIVARQNATPG
jgi:hypothetical protein